MGGSTVVGGGILPLLAPIAIGLWLLLLQEAAVVDAQIGPGNGPVVDTPYGKVRGRRATYSGQAYEEYLGIPFAAPPVGPLRWEKPAPLAPWGDEIHDATKVGPHCTHFLAFGYPVIGFSAANGEDCLYLNVWVPGGVEATQGRQLPVMVWIYGGAFFFGTGEMYPGYALALHGDVIIVNFNYRLSTLGFMSTGDGEAPGNYGLWDVQAALRWVQANIASFNGDPSKVTIFGQSAGSATVSHSIISPHTNDLFQNAISVSGGATAYWALTNQSLSTTMLLGELLDCGAHSTAELVACLREKDAHELDFWGFVTTMAVSGKITNLLPVIDGDFVPRHPVESFKMGVGKDINWVTGSAMHDAAGFILGNFLATPALEDRINIAENNETLWLFAHSLLGWFENADDLFNAIIDMYPDIYSDDLFTRTLALTQACTEWWFASVANWEAKQHVLAGGRGKTFQYQFRHRQSFLVGYPDWVSGSHVDDVYSILGEPFLQFYRRVFLRSPWDDLDTQISNTIMDYYSNFAHTGDPNEGPFRPAVEWVEFHPELENFLVEAELFHMEQFYEGNAADRFRFWTDVFHGLWVPNPPPTFPPPPELSADSTARLEREEVGGQRAEGRKFTEEDIQRAIVKLKAHIRAEMPDEGAWRAAEHYVDHLVNQRKTKL